MDHVVSQTTAPVPSAVGERRTGPQVLVIMGVSGCGKSTVAALLAGRYGWAFEEGDALHRQSNVDKMHRGHPLADEDTIAARLAVRQGHFMPSNLLHSQFDSLEEPQPDEPATRVNIGPAPEAIVAVLNLNG